MNLLKNREIYILITLFLLSLNPKLINSQNLCPYTELPDLLKYFIKGINPSFYEEKDQYKWEYIHCVNNYSNSTFLLRDSKDPYFNENAGVFIGSSINIGKLNKDFIRNNLANLTELKPNDIEKMINLTGVFGEKAEKIIVNITFNFTSDEINYINEKVYEQYLIEMRQFFELDKILKSDLEYSLYSFELNLLTFYVKYYGMDKYLNEAKECLLLNMEDNHVNFFAISYFFLNLKSQYYTQRKLWSLVALSCDRNYWTNDIRHIGIYYDSRLDPDYKKEFKNYLLNSTKEMGLENYYYSLGNFTNLLFDNPLKRDDFHENINFFDFDSNYTGTENITKGIEIFKEAFNKSITQENNGFYQKHLIIFINDINNINENIITDYFIKNGIQVILFAKIFQKSDEKKLKEIFYDEFNIITFSSYKELESKKEYLMILRNLINYNIPNFYYGDNTNSIAIQNVKTYGKDNMQNYKIIFDKKSMTSLNDNEIYYFHISLKFNNAKDIETKYNNNANLTFLVSENNPYPDIINKNITNFCFKEIVSSDNVSPFINYKNLDNFYIAIINANDINFSLNIELKKNSPGDIQDSNGVFEHKDIDYTEGFIATFSSKCIKEKCSVDYTSFLKYFSSGVHYNKAQDKFNQIIDMNMIGCLYKNVFCAFFEMEKTDVKYENGPMIGYGLNLSNVSSINFFNGSIPIYLINKLHPFLAEVIGMDKPSEILKNYNLNLTSEEIDMVNKYYLSSIYKDLNANHKNFDKLNDNLKLAIFLRILEQRPKQYYIHRLLDYLISDNIDKYIQSLRELPNGRMSTPETKDFQMMLTQTKNIKKPKKCLLSLVIGKSLLKSEEFFELISKMHNYRISITYYDQESEKAELLIDFNEDIDEIKNKITEFKNNNDKQKTEKIVIDTVLIQQKQLFKYYDECLKKCIVIISVREEGNYRYEFEKPNNDLLQELYNSGITIFDYSDRINFILDDEYGDDIGFFNSNKNEYIQFVPFLNFSDMSENVLTLTNIINRFPIPINKLQDIYLDMEENEEIVFEFNLKNEIDKLNNKNGYDNYKNLTLSFDSLEQKIHVYFSDKFIFPNNYSNTKSFEIKEDNKKISFNLKELNNSYKFYMTIQTENKIENSAVYLDLCDVDNNCLKSGFYFKFYLGFIIFGVFVFFYGIYICFCDNTFKKEGNIFEIK